MIKYTVIEVKLKQDNTIDDILNSTFEDNNSLLDFIKEIFTKWSEYEQDMLAEYEPHKLINYIKENNSVVLTDPDGVVYLIQRYIPEPSNYDIAYFKSLDKK